MKRFLFLGFIICWLLTIVSLVFFIYCIVIKDSLSIIICFGECALACGFNGGTFFLHYLEERKRY